MDDHKCFDSILEGDSCDYAYRFECELLLVDCNILKLARVGVGGHSSWGEITLISENNSITLILGTIKLFLSEYKPCTVLSKCLCYIIWSCPVRSDHLFANFVDFVQILEFPYCHILGIKILIKHCNSLDQCEVGLVHYGVWERRVFNKWCGLLSCDDFSLGGAPQMSG